MSRATEIRGIEFDWLASDAPGHVAFFSTAGGGYAPEQFLLDTDAHDAAVDAILALPASTRACLAPQLPFGLRNIWRMMAERGFFAFDSDPNGGPYHLVAAPEFPTRVSVFPTSVSEVLVRIVFHNAKFGDVSEVSEGMIREWLSEGRVARA